MGYRSEITSESEVVSQLLYNAERKTSGEKAGAPPAARSDQPHGKCSRKYANRSLQALGRSVRKRKFF